MCDALYARNAEKPQFARARRTRDDPQTESGDNAMVSGGAVPGAVLAVTDELHGLGYLADVAVGTTLTYDSGRRNKVRLVAKIPTKTEDGGEARIEVELKREDVWTLAFWPATEDEAVNARPEWSKLTEFRKRVAVAIMSKNEPPLHPEDGDLIDDRELEEMLSVVSWSEEERTELMRFAYSPLKTPDSVAMLRKLEEENAFLKLQATTDKARAGLAKIEEEAESARQEAEDARRQLAAARAEADERVRKAEADNAFYIEKWKAEEAKSKKEAEESRRLRRAELEEPETPNLSEAGKAPTLQDMFDRANAAKQRRRLEVKDVDDDSEEGENADLTEELEREGFTDAELGKTDESGFSTLGELMSQCLLHEVLYLGPARSSLSDGNTIELARKTLAWVLKKFNSIEGLTLDTNVRPGVRGVEKALQSLDKAMVIMSDMMGSRTIALVAAMKQGLPGGTATKLSHTGQAVNTALTLVSAVAEEHEALARGTEAQIEEALELGARVGVRFPGPPPVPQKPSGSQQAAAASGDGGGSMLRQSWSDAVTEPMVSKEYEALGLQVPSGSLTRSSGGVGGFGTHVLGLVDRERGEMAAADTLGQNTFETAAKKIAGSTEARRLLADLLAMAMEGIQVSRVNQSGAEFVKAVSNAVRTDRSFADTMLAVDAREPRLRAGERSIPFLTPVWETLCKLRAAVLQVLAGMWSSSFANSNMRSEELARAMWFGAWKKVDVKEALTEKALKGWFEGNREVEPSLQSTLAQFNQFWNALSYIFSAVMWDATAPSTLISISAEVMRAVQRGMKAGRAVHGYAQPVFECLDEQFRTMRSFNGVLPSLASALGQFEESSAYRDWQAQVAAISSASGAGAGAPTDHERRLASLEQMMRNGRGAGGGGGANGGRGGGRGAGGAGGGRGAGRGAGLRWVTEQEVRAFGRAHPNVCWRFGCKGSCPNPTPCELGEHKDVGWVYTPSQNQGQ